MSQMQERLNKVLEEMLSQMPTTIQIMLGSILKQYSKQLDDEKILDFCVLTSSLVEYVKGESEFEKCKTE